MDTIIRSERGLPHRWVSPLTPAPENAVLRAMEEGEGITLLDPYGDTADNLLRRISAGEADRVRLIRLGDREHPVPMGLWCCRAGESSALMARGLGRLLADHFGDRETGVPSSWETWLGNLLPAAQRVFGTHLSLEALCALSQERRGSFLRILRKLDLSLYARASSPDENACVWEAEAALARRLRPELTPAPFRSVFAAGTNALDFPAAVNGDTVTLIDLGAQIYGPEAAALMGSMILLQLWEALRVRPRPYRVHRLFLCGAGLFRTHPLPEMLRDGEKTGLSVSLICGGSEDLSPAVRRAADSRIRPDDGAAFSPSDPPGGPETEAEIRDRSLKTLWEPWHGWGWRALTLTEEERFLGKLMASPTVDRSTDTEELMAMCSDRSSMSFIGESGWLRKWIRYKLRESAAAEPEEENEPFDDSPDSGLGFLFGFEDDGPDDDMEEDI